MTQADPLYFPRSELAERLLSSLKDGILHAITLFAPRRMGKTQFLLNDVKPKAEKLGFNVFYFSFMDRTSNELSNVFTRELIHFLDVVDGKTNNLFDKLKAIDLMGVSVELQDKNQTKLDELSLVQIINAITESSDKPVLMLLDEVQELARVSHTIGLIRSLRTGLDINQQKIKVIFTGSSTNGLRAMFNDNKAPFFHFAHPLYFPNLGKDFTDFLADIYHSRTGQEIDKNQFYELFERFNFTPLYMRSIAQDMIINPNLSLRQASEYRITQMSELGDSVKIWQELSSIEREILKSVVNGENALYSKEKRAYFAKALGIEDISSSTIQGKVRKLERKELITRNANGTIKINSPYFQTWIKENS